MTALGAQDSAISNHSHSQRGQFFLGTHRRRTMQMGQNIHDPLTPLNSHLGFGAMGLNHKDPSMLSGLRPRLTPANHSSCQMQSMLNSPPFLERMSSMLSNPAILDQIVAMNPRFASGFRQMAYALTIYLDTS